ncbi:bifunctional phosphoribosylaminoimidazolecarboxamide formyltransferase/IMP cyclohydrolase [Clostridium thermarum]|uniref:bifunctional phosphoribosylaminoimidazolecarboxamide formyltransferase/IMP cyclohydrolase n=1 Tax=Clostridium thermarum TaxID=1716543 RepID=UPI0013D42B68|nr:bifunctional phosphoribosylaminoimidazolecarboxamide formyltransferase/IMP cyclohydrolase [Clostridium thermarum]
MINRALISVYNKEGLLELCSFLVDKDVEIISTGGTYRFLKDNNLPVTEVSEITGFPEMLNGRVKTLHPKIHGGILALRENSEHMEALAAKNISTIDMVVVNLYPFFDKVTSDIAFEEKIEFIDIGGPTMLRSSAKNFKDVVVISDVKDYAPIMEEIKSNGDVSFETRKRLAGKVFNLTSAYDASISSFLLDNEPYPEYYTISYRKAMELRYGENPHQTAAYYTSTTRNGAMKNFEVLNGKELSYNNLKDLDVAWKVVCEFDEIACCGLKHNSPCGVALGSTVADAYIKAYECDPTSIFGGIVAVNRKIDKITAEEMVKTFLEVVAAPDYDEAALEVLRTKKNLRVIKCPVPPSDEQYMVSIDGGLLVQQEDKQLIDSLTVVTEKAPEENDMEDLIFGMKVVKYVKSNAIVVVKNKMAVGIGGGQVNRIWAAAQALDRAKDGTVLASDAFFPFNDVVEEAAKYGVKAIIQPGGSIRDKDSIEACNKHNMAMVFTGIRHFKH